MSDYRVSLPEFHGPLDLLLHLVKRNEIDIVNIPMATIVEQFRAYLDVLQIIDVELAGEFLVTATVLMEIKSKMLLPRPEEHTSDKNDDDDPRSELVKQLLEYQRNREALARLEGRAIEHRRHLARVPNSSGSFDDQGEVHVQSVELWDLLSAFGRLVQEVEDHTPSDADDDTPQHVFREQVLSLVQGAGRLPFREVFVAPFTRSRLVGFFLALLELIRSSDVALTITEGDESIWVTDPRQTMELK